MAWKAELTYEGVAVQAACEAVQHAAQKLDEIDLLLLAADGSRRFWAVLRSAEVLPPAFLSNSRSSGSPGAGQVLIW